MQFFDASTVRARTPMPALVQALRRAFLAGAEVPQRHPHSLPGGGSMLLMPAWREGGRLGLKSVTVCPGNGALGLPGVHGLYSLFDAATGVPLAVMDGSELTARRTAAASALAAAHLARRDAARLLLVGAGRVAALLPEAMRAVRPTLVEVAVWARRGGAAEGLAAQCRAAGFEAHAVDDLAAAAARAHIVSCATMSGAALVHGAWLGPGAHLDLIGSYAPNMREADGPAFAQAGVWVDTAEALAKAGDVLMAIEEGCFEATRTVGTLADLVHGRCRGREREDERTLFKSVGNAIEDLAAAELVFDGPG
ncbi:MAG: ornithine cyclodeaminase family protein [Rubrivivax sp.]|nr:ornithine cyclodeaminase family protein [Rubrivivax sp.]